MLNRLLTYLKSQLVADAPNAVAACLECGVVDCAAARIHTCPIRIAQAAALDARAAAELAPAAAPCGQGLPL